MKKVFILLLAISVFSACGSQQASFSKNIDVKTFKKLVDEHAGKLIDVRTPQEVAGGYIAGATNINFMNPDFDSKISKLDKSETYLVYCASGARSDKAVKKMKAMGFKRTYNLLGGFMGWRRNGYPAAK